MTKETLTFGEFFKPILQEVVMPNEQAILAIFNREGIAVVVDGLTGGFDEDVRHLGWDGAAVVFEMQPDIAARLAVLSKPDEVTQRWLERPRVGRLYVCTGMGTLLVNYDPVTKNWSPEPRSTDAAYLS